MRKTFKKIKKLDTCYHPETNFVCKSMEDKRIIGKWINKEIQGFVSNLYINFRVLKRRFLAFA